MKTDLGQSDRAVAINPEAVIEERYAFMDGVHFQHHLGTDGQAAPLYASVADVLKYEPCAAECGVVKVKVVAMSWPIAQDLEPAAPEAPADARSDDRIQRMKDAIEGECNGLAITDDHAKAILEYVGAQLADEQFERGRREGMEKERALWNRWLRGFGAQVPAAQLVGFVKNFERSLAAMQHPSGGDQRTEGSGSSDRAQAQAVQRPVDGDGAN